MRIALFLPRLPFMNPAERIFEEKASCRKARQEQQICIEE